MPEIKMDPFEELAQEIERIQLGIKDPNQETAVMMMSFTAIQKIEKKVLSNPPDYIFDAPIKGGDLRFVGYTNESILWNRLHGLIDQNTQSNLARYFFKIPKMTYDWNLVAIIMPDGKPGYRHNYAVPIVLDTTRRGTTAQLYITNAPMDQQS